MRKTRKTAAVLALYAVLMLGSASVVSADQVGDKTFAREQASEQTDTSKDNSAQTTEASTTETTTEKTTEAKPTTEQKDKTDTSHKKTVTSSKKERKTTEKQKKATNKKKKDKKDKKKDTKQIIPKVYNDHSIEMKGKKETIEGFIYFNQADAAWNDNGYQIHSSGCGPTAMAVCISSLTGKWVTPVDTTIWAYNHGYYTSAGASHEMVPALARQYKLSCNGLGTDINKIRSALKKKHPVVSLMGPGYFTKKGHFIVLVAIDDNDQVTVADVGSRERTQYKYPLKDVVAQTKSASAGGPCWEIYSKDKKVKKTNNTKAKTIQAKKEFKDTSKMYAEIKAVLQKNYHLTVPLKKGTLVNKDQFVTVSSLTINDKVTVMDVSKKLTTDVDLQKVVSEIKTDAVKGSFWNTVTIEPNKTNVTE
nr:C39 family peptidase [uncultured Anaerostipes sp.]